MGRADRQRNVLEFTLSSLLRRKWRNAALFLVYTAVVFMLASVVFFTHALSREASLVLSSAPDLVVQRMSAGRQDLVPLSYIGEIEGIRGVASVSGRLWGYYYDPATGANYTIMVPPPGAEGLLPEAAAVSEGAIAVGKGLARSRGADEGDTIALRTYGGGTLGLKVKAVFSPASELVSSDLMLVSERDFRALFGQPEGFVTDLAVVARNSRELATIAGKVVAGLPDTRPITRDEVLRTYDAVLGWRGGLMVAALSGAVLAFVIFAWDRASGLSAEERREIGVLKAIGWETSDVLLMKFWEGASVSLTAFIAGAALAYVHVFFASTALLEPVLKGWSVLYPEFRLAPSVDYYQLSSLFFLTVVPYIAATIAPSWRAATADPDTVMRA